MPILRRARHLVLLVALVALPACGEDSRAAGRDALDHAGKALDAAGQAVRTSTAAVEAVSLLQKLQEQLRGVADGPTAQRVRAEVEQRVQELHRQFEAIGGASGALDAVLQKVGTDRVQLMQALDQRIAALQQNADVQRVLGPQLEQLRELLGR
ncbi:MAG: hypothetical protein AB7O97_17510 [Planctomycetota bacterium]